MKNKGSSSSSGQARTGEFMVYRSSWVVSNRRRFGLLGAWMWLGIGRGGRGECVGVLTKAQG
jgi:hypothetical protein